MMTAILNSAILNLAILDSAILIFPLKFIHTCQDWFPPFAQKKTFTHSFWLNLMMAATLNSAILDSATLVFPLKLIHTCQDWFPPFAQNKISLPLPSLPFAQKILHSFILTQLDNGSHLEFCHVGFRHLLIFSQIHSKTLSLHSDSDSNYYNLTQTHSFWLNLMMAAILNLAILNSAILVFPLKLTHTCQDWFPQFAQKKPSLIHCDSTWWW